MNATFLTREKEALLEDIDSLRKQHDEFSAQQSQWEELRRTNESIEKLTALVSQADREELKDLRRSRDRFKVLEGEHAALQRRLRDAETKAANSERAAASTRQTLSQTQTRAVEWEKRAKDYESDLEDARSRLDQAERSNTELDADLSAARLQLEEKLEERDVDERSANVSSNLF